MKRLGCLLAVVGLVMFAASFAVAILYLVRQFDAREVGGAMLPLDQETTTDVVEVDTSRACQATIIARFTSKSVEERTVGGRTIHELRYRFPYTYRVVSEDGTVLHAREGSLDWRWGAPMAVPGAVGAEGGYGEVIYRLGPFRVPPPGRVRVTARVRPDVEYGAQVESLHVRVSDRVTSAAMGAGSAALFYLGPVAFSAGVVVFVIGLVRRRRLRVPQEAAAEGHEAASDSPPSRDGREVE